MTMQDIIDEIRFDLTGHVLELEIEDADIEFAVRKSLRTLTRF